MPSPDDSMRPLPLGTCTVCRGAGMVMKYRPNGSWFPTGCYPCGGTGKCPHRGRDLVAFTLRAMRFGKKPPHTGATTTGPDRPDGQDEKDAPCN